MKNLFPLVLDAIQSYESLTAGRFYSDCQKENLFELANRANFLERKEKEELFSCIFSPDLQFYQTITDCENGLLLEMVSQNKTREAILESRLKALKSITSPNEDKPWANKSEWLAYANSTTGGYKQSIEKAIFKFAVGKVDEALKELEYHAKNCDLFSLKLVTAIYNQLGDGKKELYYLLLIERIVKELYFEELPSRCRARIAQLSQEGYGEVEKSANSQNLNYFNERSTSISKIGF